MGNLIDIISAENRKVARNIRGKNSKRCAGQTSKHVVANCANLRDFTKLDLRWNLLRTCKYPHIVHRNIIVAKVTREFKEKIEQLDTEMSKAQKSRQCYVLYSLRSSYFLLRENTTVI
ncbi:uncharacterized protein LOC116853867 [Odontomachus brunneus]|uniref:uncharacterized protein LOC116853867 n=1 Tax=Odontomachus brunneus TaxID=486640 RepID=UPI0013F18862|nr:uncharacterized protein LOC116853867 [Odontomachus brunneus]